MLKTAVVWIRDGVLIDRMAVNAAAFGYASWLFSSASARKKTTLESLISFAFEKSGFSCAAKMMMYNAQRENVVADVDSAASLYNVLASAAGNQAQYFDGTIDLLRNLKSGGVDNFISAAVEQNVMDEWLGGSQGSKVAGYLTEIMGKRSRFSKGRDHFRHVSELGYQRIFYVADAISEVRTASAHSHEYNIIPIGFANEVTTADVLDAVRMLNKAISDLDSKPSTADELLNLKIDSEKIACPDPDLNRKSLAAEGALEVVEGDKKHLMPNLQRYFDKVLS